MRHGVHLEWPGKRRSAAPPAAALCDREIYHARADDDHGRLILGESCAVGAALTSQLAGRADLVYLDPPFFTGSDWSTAVKIGSERSPVAAYSDSWPGGLSEYLQWLLDLLVISRELLAETGSLYLHLGWQTAHYGRLIAEEVFGSEHFQNEIAWCYREAINSRKRWNRKHDSILFFTKNDGFTFNPQAVLEPYRDSNIRKYRLRDEKGPYRLMGRGIVGSPLQSKRDLSPQSEMDFPELTYRHYLGEGTLPVDYWQIDIENQASPLRTGYPTQKPEALLERILVASSNPGELIVDLCCGSGTTPAVAHRLGRRWIGVDRSPVAVHTACKRLLEAGAGFKVEAAGDQANKLPCTWAEQPPVLRERRDGSDVLRLAAGAAHAVDMWAVDWEPDSSGAFRARWWSARTRGSPELEDTAVSAASAECVEARVMLVSEDGVQTRITV